MATIRKLVPKARHDPDREFQDALIARLEAADIKRWARVKAEHPHLKLKKAK